MDILETFAAPGVIPSDFLQTVFPEGEYDIKLTVRPEFDFNPKFTFCLTSYLFYDIKKADIKQKATVPKKSLSFDLIYFFNFFGFYRISMKTT